MSEYVFKTDSPVKTCGECPCFHAENPMYCQVDKNIKMTCPYAKRMENCPLKELPPHGDLIDRRKLWKDTEGIGEYCHDRDFISLCDAIGDAPTILEATE